MEYQKITNLLDDVSNEPSKFRTKNWVEINDESRGGYNVNSQIKFKTTMVKSSFCDYSDAYRLVKRTITVNKTETAAAPNNRNNILIEILYYPLIFLFSFSIFILVTCSSSFWSSIVFL